MTKRTKPWRIFVDSDLAVEDLFKDGRFLAGDSWTSIESLQAVGSGYQPGDLVVLRRSDGTRVSYQTIA